ncbi:MAG: hypothetical protein ACRBM6_11125 [Geminicoccales bacterium]
MLRTFVLAALSLAVGAVCLAALLVVLGGWGGIAGPDLKARVQVHQVKVPSGYEIDPRRISDELVRRMQRRSEVDMALRVLLGEEGNELLRERAVPRLLNAGVLRRMIDEMDGLGTVIAFAGYEAWSEITVTNSSTLLLEDVAITLPHAAHAETAGGGAIELKKHDRDLSSTALGQLEPSKSLTLYVWFDRPSEQVVARSSEIRIGAADGVRGRSLIYDPAHAWNGADLEVEPWARWLVAAVLAVIACACLAVLMLLVVSLFRSRLSRAPVAPN